MEDRGEARDQSMFSLGGHVAYLYFDSLISYIGAVAFWDILRHVLMFLMNI